MKKLIEWVEIPAANFKRAGKFSRQGFQLVHARNRLRY